MKTTVTFILLLRATVSFCQNYDIYVSDAGNFNSPPWQVLKFDSAGQNPSVFINSNLNWPQDIVFFEDSNTVLVSNLGSGRIAKYDATSGSYISDFAASIAGPTRMKIGRDHLLYVLQWNGSGKVLRYHFDGTYAGEFTSSGVPQSIGLDWDSSGNLYVSSYTGALVRKFDTAGMDQGIFISSNLAGPTNIWFDTNGDLLVVDYNGTAVKRFDPAGNYLNDFITGISHAEGVGFLPDGNLLLGNGATRSVKLFDSSGNYIKDLISSGEGNLLTPNAVIIREITQVSVPEAKKIKTNFVYPTVGSEFYFNPQISQKASYIMIYSLSGNLVEVTNAHSWKANTSADGTYIIVAGFPDGSYSWQKIIVQK
jgi:hypothetical protein